MIIRTLLTAFLFTIQLLSFSQDKGILAFTGSRYYKEGINCRQLEIKVDGAFLLSNRVSLNKEMEIKVLGPQGFSEDKSRNIFAGTEITLTNARGVVLQKIPNYFKDNELKGFAVASIKELVVKFPLKAEIIKAEPGCNISLRIYDLKGKGQLRIEIPVVMARPGEAMQLSKTVNEVKAPGALQAFSANVKLKKLDVTTDTAIRVAPKMAYASLDMTGIDGSSLTEVLSGKESFWVYDTDLNEIKITDKQLKQVKGSMEDNSVDYLSKIPFRQKAAGNKSFFVRLRWESTDKRKVIDIVVSR